MDRALKPLFQAALKRGLGVDVHVSSPAAVRSSGGWKASILWTADVHDGGDLQMKLQDPSRDLAAMVEQQVTGAGLPWMKDSKASVGVECKFNYYGLAAAKLPRGQQLTQEFGQRPGGPAAEANAPVTSLQA